MDFIKLDLFQLYELYLMIHERAYEAGFKESRNLDTKEALKDIEILKETPMMSTEAVGLLQIVDEHYHNLTEAFYEDWDAEEFKLREETIIAIMSELKRIADL